MAAVRQATAVAIVAPAAGTGAGGPAGAGAGGPAGAGAGGPAGAGAGGAANAGAGGAVEAGAGGAADAGTAWRRTWARRGGGRDGGCRPAGSDDPASTLDREGSRDRGACRLPCSAPRGGDQCPHSREQPR